MLILEKLVFVFDVWSTEDRHFVYVTIAFEDKIKTVYTHYIFIVPLASEFEGFKGTIGRIDQKYLTLFIIDSGYFSIVHVKEAGNLYKVFVQYEHLFFGSIIARNTRHKGFSPSRTVQ